MTSGKEKLSCFRRRAREPNSRQCNEGAFKFGESKVLGEACGIMTKRNFFIVCLSAIAIASVALAPSLAQQNESDIHVIVNMVQVNIAVTDDKGNYVTGLHPEDFQITEDGIAEKIATFEEGNGPARRVVA